MNVETSERHGPATRPRAFVFFLAIFQAIPLPAPRYSSSTTRLEQCGRTIPSPATPATRISRRVMTTEKTFLRVPSLLQAPFLACARENDIYYKRLLCIKKRAAALVSCCDFGEEKSKSVALSTDWTLF